MRRALEDFPAEWRRSRSVLTATVVPAVALVAGIAIAGAALDIPVRQALADPLAMAGAPPLLGFLSNLGILIWAGSAGACLVAVLVLRHGTTSGDAEYLRFFVVAGALTTVLVLDDTYQLHEELIPSLLGGGQTFVILGYVVVVATFLWRFRRLILSTEWLILAAAGVTFAASIAIDLLPSALGRLPGGLAIDIGSPSYEYVSSLIEDGMKFVGITLWFVYFVRETVAAVLAIGRDGAR
jgi:hypothetical protein